MAMTARLDLGDPALAAAVADVRDDNTDTAWCQFGYEGKAKIVLAGKGSGGVDELLDEMDDSQVSFVLLRLTTGDQESKRIKFMCAHLSRSPLPHVRVISACSCCGQRGGAEWPHRPTGSRPAGATQRAPPYGCRIDQIRA